MAESIGGAANPFEPELDELGFRKDAAQPNRPIDWPYDGPRTTTITGAEVQAHETFSNVYNDLGKQVRDRAEARGYTDNPDTLPFGYAIHPQMQLVLPMLVDDPSLPNPRFPVTVPLGDTSSVELGDDGRFRFFNAKGPRLVSAQSTLMALCRAIAPFDPSVAGAINAVVDDPERWYSPAMFEGLNLTWDAVPVSINDNAPKLRAWPVGPADAATTTSAPAAASAESVQAAAEAADGNATAFQQAVMDAKGFGDANLLGRVLREPQVVMDEVLAST